MMDSTANLLHEDLNPEHFRAVFDVLPLAISWSALAGQTILYRNPAFQQLFGYDPTHFETVGEWIEAAYPFAEDRVLAWDRWGSWLTSPPKTRLTIEPAEVRILCHNGVIKTILQGVVILPEVSRAMATFTDLPQRHHRPARPASSERKAQETEAVCRMLAATSQPDDRELLNLSPWEALIGERHRQREALRLSEELLDRTGRLAGVGGWSVDLLTGAVTWTAQTHRLHAVPPGYQPTLEAGINFYAPEAREMIANVVNHAIATGEGWDVEAPLIRADGQRIWVRVIGSVELVDGKPVRLIGAFKDITHRINALNALKQATERDLQRKDDFLSHVSHELRSPLASIYSFASILADGLAGDITQPQADYLEIILRNSRQLRSMIDDLLQVTQSETGKLTIAPEKTSVPEALADALNTLRAAAKLKNIALISYSQDDLPAAFADLTRLRQVLIIILDNAVKFTPVHGVVEVRATRSSATPGHIEISIADTGPGIEQADAERIFEHLYQVQQPSREGRKGLGLGLHIARDLVQRQGGTIWVKSQPGQGSVFCFTVPTQPTNPSWGVERRRNSEPAPNQSTQPIPQEDQETAPAGR